MGGAEPDQSLQMVLPALKPGFPLTCFEDSGE